jgi:hypothetical protein
MGKGGDFFILSVFIRVHPWYPFFSSYHPHPLELRVFEVQNQADPEAGERTLARIRRVRGAILARRPGPAPERQHRVQAVILDPLPSEQSFDLAVLQFKDDGTYLDSSQIGAVVDCIRKARTSRSFECGARRRIHQVPEDHERDAPSRKLCDSRC